MKRILIRTTKPTVDEVSRFIKRKLSEGQYSYNTSGDSTSTIITIQAPTVFGYMVKISITKLHDTGIYVAIIPDYNDVWVDIMKAEFRYVANHSQQYVNDFEKQSLANFEEFMGKLEKFIIPEICKQFKIGTDRLFGKS